MERYLKGSLSLSSLTQFFSCPLISLSLPQSMVHTEQEKKKRKEKKKEQNNREEANKVLTFHFLPCRFAPLERMLSEGK